jgi:RND family efflux transporter MFP subunit
LDAGVAEASAALAKLATELGNLPFETRRAEADLTYAKTNYEGKLAAGDAVTGRVLAEAKSQLDAATAAFAELQNRAGTLAREQAAMTERRVALARQRELLADETQARDTAAAKVKAATSQAEQARVALAEAKLRLDRMTVRSPIDGRVFELLGFPGTMMADGTTRVEGHDASTVITLYQPNRLQVRVDVRFEDIPKVVRGQPVQIASPAISEPLTGRVLFISSVADIQKNTLQVKVEIEKPPPVFKPQMLVDVTFLAAAQPQSSTKPTTATRLFVPQSLVHQGEGGPLVWVADQAAGIARRTPVKTGGATSDGLIEIVSGLNVASRVIASGHEGLRDGERIRVTGEAASGGDSHPHSASERKPLERLPQHEGGQ